MTRLFLRRRNRGRSTGLRERSFLYRVSVGFYPVSFCRQRAEFLHRVYVRTSTLPLSRLTMALNERRTTWL